MSSSTTVSYGTWVCEIIRYVPVGGIKHGEGSVSNLKKGAGGPEGELEDTRLIALPCRAVNCVEYFRFARRNPKRSHLLVCFYFIEEESQRYEVLHNIPDISSQ